MGLSNQERLTKMHWGVHHLSKTIRKMAPKDGEDLYPREDEWNHLLSLGDQLWHSLLGGSQNGIFWFLGGAITNPVREPQSPWAVLISGQCARVQEEKQERQWQRRDLDEVCFDPFKHNLDIRSLVEASNTGREGERRALLLDAYNGAEFLIYGLRRYRDEFLVKFPEMDKLISDILGACFALMESDTNFGKAYVGDRLFHALYGEWDGQLWKAFNSVYMHHALGHIMSPRVSLEEVIEWDRWRITHKDTPQNRLVLAMRIAGSSLYQPKDLENLLRETRGIGIRESVIRREFAKCQKLRTGESGGEQTQEQKDHQEYRDTARAAENSVVHGFSWEWD